MKGVVIEQTGGPDVLQYQTSLPIPSPGENEVLIKNSYIGLNYIDTYYRTGLYSPKPEILGCEAEGTVVRVGTGETHGLQPGDRVVYMAPSGTYAEFTCAPSLRVVKVPSGIPDTHAVAAFLQGLTALVLIREAHPVQKGDWVLVHAAAGGCGLWLCQLLRMVGARTIGTASSREKLELAQKFGAGWTVDYTAENVVERVDEITDGQGVIAVFDGVGKVTFDADLEMLSRKGSLVSFGNASGDVPPFHIRYVVIRLLPLDFIQLNCWRRERFADI